MSINFNLDRGVKMESVLSFPNRGKWGKSNYRGNCSGYVILELLNHFNPKFFVDVCEGSGTSKEVCLENSVNYAGFDLSTGFDFTNDYVLSQIECPADIVFSHPPYHNMIKYSGNMWGDKSKNDTSQCSKYEEFLEKSQTMLMNQREATRENGIYCTLIGDYRKNGVFKSTQADFISLLPKDELISVTIKLQHNSKSNFKSYSGSFIPIMHEYLLVWKKSDKSLYAISFSIANDANNLIATTWRNAIRMAFIKLGGEAPLSEIYKEVEFVAQGLIAKNSHWKEKIRQTLQRHYKNVQRGTWAV